VDDDREWRGQRGGREERGLLALPDAPGEPGCAARAADCGRTAFPDASHAAAGQRLRRLRYQHGLTLEELAGRVGSTRQSMSRWELGGNMPPPGMRRTLALELGVAVGSIWGDC
jgi:DNA-binding XRE family transcriptional regulator